MLRLIRHVFSAVVLGLALSGTASAVSTPTFVEPDPAKHCFANAFTPEITENVMRREIVQPGYEQVRRIAATYEHRRLRVMVKDPGLSYQTAAPLYTTVYETVLVEPERQIQVDIPAKYETWTETIEIEPAKTIWKRGTALYGQSVSETATNITDRETSQLTEILCKVTIPAKTRTVKHTRMVHPPRTVTKTVPAQYKRVAKQVVQRPAFSRRVAVSGEFAAIPYQKQLAAAREEIISVPARYEDVERTVVTQASKLIQVEVLCDQQASRETVRNLQTALVERGYAIKIDGIYGPETQGAMEQFQRDEALARGYMTVESFKALGVYPTLCQPVDCRAQRAQTTVAATQSALSQAGYTAAVDGIHGPQTQAALEQFQVAHGLEVGYLSAETMQALNLLARI